MRFDDAKVLPFSCAGNNTIWGFYQFSIPQFCDFSLLYYFCKRKNHKPESFIRPTGYVFNIEFYNYLIIFLCLIMQ